MQRSIVKPLAVLMATIACTAVVCGISLTNAEASSEGGSGYDVDEYLKYIPELKPGNSVGAYAELDSDDAYQFAKIYADSFKIPVKWTSQYNQIILNSMKGSQNISDFTSNLYNKMLEHEGIDRNLQVTPKFNAFLAFTLTVGGTDVAPTLVVMMNGQIDAALKISESREEMINATAKIPVTLYAEIQMNEEKIPTGIDFQLKLSYDVSLTDSTGEKSVTTTAKADYLDFKFSANVDKLTANELNAIINDDSNTVNKKLNIGMLIEITEYGEKHGYGTVNEITADLSKLGISDAITDIASELKNTLEDTSVADIEGDIKSLMRGIIPSYDDVKWLLDLAGIDKTDYTKASILGLPYLSQTVGILKEIRSYVSANDLTSYFVKWNGSMIHEDEMGKIIERAKVYAVTFETDQVANGECYEFQTYDNDAYLYRFTYWGSQTNSLNITIPSELMGKNVVGLWQNCFEGQNTVKLTLTLPDTMEHVSRNAVTGYDYSGIGGTIKYYPNNNTEGYGFTLISWMDDGESHASVSGWINGGVTSDQVVEIPSKITLTGQTGKNAEVTIDGIEMEAFRNCSELVGITVPNTVTDIGYMAFAYCENLKTATIKGNVHDFDSTFYGCTGLEMVTIESSNASFIQTFYECTSLKTIDMGSVPAEIGYQAFYNVNIDPTCMESGEKTVSWIDSVTNIAENSFSKFTGPGGTGFIDGSNTSYRSWKVDGEYVYNITYRNISSEDDEFVIPAKASFEGKYVGDVIEVAIEGSGIATLTVKNPLKSLNVYNLPNLTTLNIGAPIDYLNLNNLPELKTVNPDGSNISTKTTDGFLFVMKGDLLLFCNGTGSTINLPETIRSIHGTIQSSTAIEIVLNGPCTNLSNLPENIITLTLGPNVDSLDIGNIPGVQNINALEGNDSYKSIDGVLFSTDGELIKYPSGRAGETYKIPAECRTIGYHAFYESQLKTITLNDGLRHIDTYAFSECDATLIPGIDNDSVFVRNQMLYSDDTAIRYLGNADVVILSGTWSHDVFKTSQPKTLIIQDYTGSWWINDYDKINMFIVPSTMYSSIFNNMVSYSSNWMYTPTFTTDGKTITVTVSTSPMVELTGVFLDSERISSESTFEFNLPETSGNKRLNVDVQPAKYSVTFDTSGGPSVASQEVYYHYPANIPSDPYRSGFTFTGWYADKRCTVAFDFESPILENTTIYAGWRVVQVTPSEPSEPSQPDKPSTDPDEPKVTEKTTTSTDSEGNTVTKTEKNTEFSDGSKVSSETTTVVKDDGNSKETTTESKETVTDASGNVTGSTSSVKTERENNSGKTTVTSTTSKDGNGNDTQTSSPRIPASPHPESS